MPDASPLCTVMFGCGPAYLVGRSSREQPFWAEHAAFIDALTTDGRIVLAGPFTDWTGSLLIVRGEPPEVERMFAADPFVLEGVFAPATVRPWVIWVDEREAS